MGIFRPGIGRRARQGFGAELIFYDCGHFAPPVLIPKSAAVILSSLHPPCFGHFLHPRREAEAQNLDDRLL